ncbi:hypothetical protein CEXT_653411 [Caerostris extrusa]|uniref:Uncharacterized protein n=1 Tax=Caerostris extrusa TaxID=172846 RepID=A0AAV4WEK8_CAEEX|nr:hypothetical protein CEXT_653411 [Caerostris extrusa]
MVLGCSIPRLLCFTPLRPPFESILEKVRIRKGMRSLRISDTPSPPLPKDYPIRFPKVLPPAFSHLPSSLFFLLVCSGKKKKRKKKWKKGRSIWIDTFSHFITVSLCCLKNRYLRKCRYAKKCRFENLRHPLIPLSEDYAIRFPKSFLQHFAVAFFTSLRSHLLRKKKKNDKI